jgi:hypothetical protein
VACLLALLALGACLAVPAAVRAAPPGRHCVNLAVVPGLNAELLAAHRRNGWPHDTGPRPGSVFYGRCSSEYYALAAFRNPDDRAEGSPVLLRRTPAFHWVDVGGVGADPCPFVPAGLARLWGLRCATTKPGAHR